MVKQGLILILTAAMAGGCGGDFMDMSGRPAASIVPDRRQWTVTGDVSRPARAADANAQTAAVSAAEYDGATVTVDFGKACLFNLAVIDHGPYEMGFAKRVAISTSLDGETFTYRKGATGTRGVTAISLITPVLARYVQFKAVMPGDQPWSVAEIHFQ